MILTFTHEQRTALARKFGIPDPMALTPEDIVRHSRSFSEDARHRDVEREYVDLLGVETEEREYGDDEANLPRSEQQYREFLNVLKPGR